MPFLDRLWNAEKKMYANGGRPLTFAYAYFLGAIVILAAATVFAFCGESDTYAPLEYVNPQVVSTPLVAPGGSVVVTAIKCVKGKDSVYIEGRSWFIRAEPPLTILYKEGNRAQGEGCLTRVFENELPADIPPGEWQIQGLDVAFGDNGQIQREPWYTEVFTVEGQVDGEIGRP